MKTAMHMLVWNNLMNFWSRNGRSGTANSVSGTVSVITGRRKSVGLLQLLVCGILLLSFTSYHLHAEDPAERTPSPGTGITFSGTYTEAVMVEGSEQITLEGNAWVETSRTRIEADSIRIYGENFRFADCEGNVVIVDSEQDITLYCTHLEYDRETLTAVLYGWVEMEDRKNQLTARGAYMKNEANAGITTIHIAARIRKHTDSGEMLCRTHAAVYSSRDEELVLTGNSEVYWNDDAYRADRIKIDLETNDIILQGDVTGKIAD